MKFIKAIQKSDGAPQNLQRKSTRKDVGEDARISRVLPGLLADEGLRIGGSPPSAKTKHSLDQNGAKGPRIPRTPADDLQPYKTAIVDPALVNRHLVAITEPVSAFAEEYRDLRTTLLQRSKKQKLNTIAIVSVAPEEGKSVTAINLAWLLAQTPGVNALVIDGDMRRPSLCRYLNIEEGPGLSELLDGEAALSDVIVRLEPSGLHLLPGGRTRSDVAEQISGPNFAAILESAQERFDYIIIDAPPLGVFVDAKVLINQTDGALLVVRRNFTKFKDVDRVLEGLPMQRMLGVVLNQAEETLISGRYYYDQY